MNERERQNNAKRFASEWMPKNLGREKQDTHQFWISLLSDIFGIEGAYRRFIDFEKKVKLEGSHVGYIDAYIPDTKVLIEQKGRGISLTEKAEQSDGSMLNPYEQARRYAEALNYNEQPRWIITCNFDEFRIYDQNNKNDEPVVVTLQNFEDEYRRLSILIDREADAIPHEVKLSVEAGALIGKLYRLLRIQYGDELSESLIDRSLNVLCVRLAFCLYAEDSGLFGRHAMFHDYLRSFKPEQVHIALITLFQVLDTEVEKRSRLLGQPLASFPYVNGGLFKDDPTHPVEIPPFTEEIMDILLKEASEGFDWRNISPTIFGAVFESTLNKETQRKGGMHYTSVENIHKVIDPLFLDELKAEYKHILSYQVIGQRNNALKKFQEKLGQLTFLDPACGSGNFLTETYLCLRRLENDTLRVLTHGQSSLGYEFSPIQVNINQFYGIEINDFAVTVARTALWIAEHQMMQETEDIVHMNMNFLPLKSYTNIHEGNALRIDWAEVIPPECLSYIIGNPPFVGYKMQSPSQKEDLRPLFGNVKTIDYVSGWFYKATQFIQKTSIKCSFVATNSITQGEQVAAIWKNLYEKFCIDILYAYRTFKWESEAVEQAGVHCVIIGFCANNKDKKFRKIYDGDQTYKVETINPYLIDAEPVFLESRPKPICNCELMSYGSEPREGGFLIFSPEERNSAIANNPELTNVIKRFMSADDYINNLERYCLWVTEGEISKYRRIKVISDRLKKCKEFREKSKQTQANAASATPYLFASIRQPNTNFLLIPIVSSENRKYIPIGYIDKNVIVSNAVFTIANASMYTFGVISSSVHMAWVRAVAGRLEMRYRYSNKIVYNNFVWPEPTHEQKSQIVEAAKKILTVRAKYQDKTLADLYSSTEMPKELIKAHQENDKAVMAAYGFKSTMSEAEIVAELFKLYKQYSEKIKEKEKY